MIRKCKFKDNDKLYFVSFATINWIDVFIRNEYKEVLLDSLRYCQREKGLEVYAWCIMTSHVHLIIGSVDKPLADIMRDLKSFTSRKLREAIQTHLRESRREWLEWLIWLFERAGQKNGNNQDWQFWQQDNHPIELYNPLIMQQKLDYLHQNPVETGFVDEAKSWLYSSSRDYWGEKGLLDIILIE